MNIKVFITVDTEEDSWKVRSRSNNSVNNAGRLPQVQDLMNKFGAIPTYLANYPIAADPASSGILRELYQDGNCEIGTHCHPWNTPPFEEEITDYNSMLNNLPLPLIQKKMRNLHRAIEKNLDLNPVSFRTGRWGFGTRVARCLRELGYLVDSSVIPLWNWTDYHGPDFSKAPTSIYRFSSDDVLREKEDGDLIEVPVTMSFLQSHFKMLASMRRKIMNSPLSRLRLLGLLEKAGLANLIMLSPETSSGSDMITASENFVKSEHTCLNMMFHSTSLIPGGSDFVRDESDLEEFMDSIGMFLDYCRNRGFDFCSLNSAVED